MKSINKFLLFVPYIGVLYMLVCPAEYIGTCGKFWEKYHGFILGSTPFLIAIGIGVLNYILK